MNSNSTNSNSTDNNDNDNDYNSNVNDNDDHNDNGYNDNTDNDNGDEDDNGDNENNQHNSYHHHEWIMTTDKCHRGNKYAHRFNTLAQWNLNEMVGSSQTTVSNTFYCKISQIQLTEIYGLVAH